MTHAGYDDASPADPIRIHEEEATISTTDISTHLADCDSVATCRHVDATKRRPGERAVRIAEVVTLLAGFQSAFAPECG